MTTGDAVKFAIGDTVRVDDELCKITDIDTGTEVMTVVRAWAGTSGASHDDASQVIGIGTVICCFQRMVLPDTSPDTSLEPIAPDAVPVKLPLQGGVTACPQVLAWHPQCHATSAPAAPAHERACPPELRPLLRWT
jgi:hypothetical protein